MKNYQKILALAMGSVMALSLFAACGEKVVEPIEQEEPASARVSDNGYARICYDNLGLGYISEADTQIVVKGATITKVRDGDGNTVDASKVATYNEKTGLFTAVGEGYIMYTLADGSAGRLEVVPAYVTDPGNQYTGSSSDMQLGAAGQGGTYLGNTHDPSFVQTYEAGAPVYYLFSTGWNTGNDIHVSYDGMLTWEYAGKAIQENAISDKTILPQGLLDWMGASNNSGDIQWWAPDIVPAYGGGYWMYTCTVMSDSIISRATYNSPDVNITPSTNYSRAAIVLFYTDSLDKDWTTDSFEYVGVLMQSAIPQTSLGSIDINSIDPQIIYDDEGNMYMAYGSFGTGNWILELDPTTGLRKDGVYADGEFKDLLTIRKERNKVVSGDENSSGGSAYLTKFLGGEEVTSDFYGRMISLGAMEAPIIARHDDVKAADETATYDKFGEPEGVAGKTYYYSMHSYNGLSVNYQMWGGRSESVWGIYRATSGGLVYNVNVGSSANQGNKYMGAFMWRDGSKVEGCTEFNIVLPGHNDLYTTDNNINVAAYITRTKDFSSGDTFGVQIHQYYLNSMGDICINPNRYSGEIDRSVSKEELLALTDGGRFEMVVLTNSQDATLSGTNGGIKNVSMEVVLTEDGKITKDGAEIGTWVMYGKGYIKFTFAETLKGSSSGYDSYETVYYGVVRPAWLGNRNQSGFTITCMGHTEGLRQNMAMFMNSYSTIEGDGLIG